jgi:fatty-acyl-CoA synthase
LRVAIVGGEVVRADTLAAFTDAFHHHGLRPQAICPAYGMAEVGLAVTMTRPEERWRERRVCASALADERLLVPEPSAPVTTLVANGPPLVGYGVRCEAGADATGPLRVKAPSIGADGTTGAALAAPDGWYDTGDTGFITDGSIYVCGRRGDYLTAHARNIYAPAVEQAVGEVPGIRPGRVTAVSMPTGEWAIVAEPAALGCLSPAEERRLESDIQRAAVTATGARADKVQVVERGTLPLTSSGKLQRAEVRARLLRDAL